MIVSANEIHGVVRKAALGAKLSGGIADDIAAATAWAEAHGIAALGEALAVIREGGVARLVAPFDLIAAGEADAQLEVGALGIGFAAVAAISYGDGFKLEWPGAVAQVSASGLAVSGSVQTGRATISRCEEGEPTPVLSEISVDRALWDDANRLASAYYVPATEASRLGGAGAGVNDND